MRSVRVWVLAVVANLALALPSYTQCCSGSGCSNSGAYKVFSHGDSDASDKLSASQPYGGQIFCPVTGEKLGLRNPAVAVQTAVGEKKPSFVGKLFGKKSTPGAIIYVCCPACAGKVRSDPNPYLMELIADKGCFVYTYASAPAKRPLRIRTDGGGRPDIAAADLYRGEKRCPVTGAELGSMGPAVPVTIQGQTLELCCQGCVPKVQRDPETYLRKVEAERTGQR